MINRPFRIKCLHSIFDLKKKKNYTDACHIDSSNKAHSRTFWCPSGYLSPKYRIKQIKWIIQWEFLFNSEGNLLEKLQLRKLEVQGLLKYVEKCWECIICLWSRKEQYAFTSLHNRTKIKPHIGKGRAQEQNLW